MGRLLKQANQATAGGELGLLAHAGESRAIYGCNYHEQAVLIFDMVVLRFRRSDLVALLELWEETAQPVRRCIMISLLSKPNFALSMSH